MVKKVHVSEKECKSYCVTCGQKINIPKKKPRFSTLHVKIIGDTPLLAHRFDSKKFSCDIY